MTIQIKKTVGREVDHRVMTVPWDVTPEITFPEMTDATPDDLRRACEAVGMVAMPGNVGYCDVDKAAEDYAQLKSEHDALERALTTEKARAEKAVAALANEQAIANAVCDDLRTKLAAAEGVVTNMLDFVAHELGVVNVTTGDTAWQLIFNYIEALRAATSKSEEEADALRTRAEKAEGELAVIGGSYADASRERDDLRTKLAAAERERDEASALARCDTGEPWESECMRARKEVDDLRATLTAAEAELTTLRENYRQRGLRADELGKRLSALTAPVEGEPTLQQMLAARIANDGDAMFALRQWRAGYAACAACAARHQRTEPRASLNDLVQAYGDALRRESGQDVSRCGEYSANLGELAGINAVAAKVRAERPAYLVEPTALMPNLKTTPEERALFRSASLPDNNDRERVTRILDDLDTLVAEVAKLSSAMHVAHGALMKIPIVVSGPWKVGDRARYRGDEVILTSVDADWINAKWVGDDGSVFGHLGCHTTQLRPIEPVTSNLKTTPEERAALRAIVERGVKPAIADVANALDDLDTLTSVVDKLRQGHEPSPPVATPESEECSRCGGAKGEAHVCGDVHYSQSSDPEIAAYGAGYAEGRAKERAAIVAWLRSGWATFSRGGLAMQIEQGVHV